jgi:hypothetical protein
MSRRIASFRQHDLTRALRAARAAGLEVSGYEIDLPTGKIIVTTNARTEPKTTPDFLDKWLAKHSRSAP